MKKNRVTFSGLFSLSAEDGRLILSSNSDIDISARQSLDFVANDIVLKAHTVSRRGYRTRSLIVFCRFVFKTNRFTLKNCDFLIALKVRLLAVILNRILYASARTVWYSLLLIVDNMLSIVGNNTIIPILVQYFRVLFSSCCILSKSQVVLQNQIVSHTFFLK